MNLADAGRPALPKGAPVESGATGVPDAAPDAKLNVNGRSSAKIVRVGVDSWDFSALQNSILFPSPFEASFVWPEGYIPPRIRKQMARHPKIYQCTEMLVAAIVGDGGRVVPCVAPNHPDFAKAKEIADFCSWALRNMVGSWYLNLRQMLTAVVDGNRVAFWSMRLEENSRTYKNKETLDELQILPIDTYTFYEDEYGRVTWLNVSYAAEDEQDWPRGKFAILTYRPMNGKLDGSTVYAPAYEPYYEDCQAVGELFAYAATFGRPSVIIIAPEVKIGGMGLDEQKFPLEYADGSPVMEVDKATGLHRQKMGTAVQQNAIMFTMYRAGGVWSVEGGTKVEIAQARPGGSELFTEIRDRASRNMAAAILGTDKLTESGPKESATDRESGENVTGLGVTDGKRSAEEMVENDLLTLLVDRNYGAAYRDLLPIFDLGSGQNGRLAKMHNSIVGFVTNGTFTVEQWWEYCKMTGLPLPYPGSERVNPQAGNRVGGGDKQPSDGGGSNNSDNADASDYVQVWVKRSDMAIKDEQTGVLSKLGALLGIK
jgi:hypothetical protein